MRSTSDFSIFGPSRFARYRAGGCEAPSCNVSTQIWIDLHGEIEQEIRKSGIHHSDEEVRRAASIRFMDLYTKDVRSIKDEWRGKEIIPADDLLITEQGVMTQIGDKLVLAEHEFITKRQEKGTEDKAESATLRAAISAIQASPDAEVYFPVHNKGNDGSDQIRYIAHWKRSGDRIKTETINIVGDQPDKTHPETSKAIRTIVGMSFTEHSDSSRAYIFTRGADEGRVRFAKPRVEKNNVTHNRVDITIESIRRDDVRERFPNQTGAREVYKKATIDTMFTDTVMHVGNRVLHDTKDTAVALGAFMLRRASEQDSDKRRAGKKDDRRVARRITDRIRELFSKTAEDERNEGQPIRLTLEKIREKPEKLVEACETRHAEMQKSMRALLVAAETKVALGAVPLILVSLAKEHPKPIRPVEKSIRRHKKKELRTSAKREAQKDSAKVQPLRSERVEPLRAAKERKRRKKRTTVNREMIAGGRRHIVSERSEWKTQERRVKRGKEKRIKIIATASKMIPSASEKREGREKRRLRWVTKKAERMVEAKKLPKIEKKLWAALAVAAGEFNPTNPTKRDQSNQAGPIRPIHETMRKWSNKKIEDKKREMIAGVQFAWIVWMMLNRANFPPGRTVRYIPPVESKSATLVSERRGVKLVHPSGVEHEGSPWVLLSIIWHLTAIREQGMGNYPMKKKRRKLPKKGIIFAFRS